MARYADLLYAVRHRVVLRYFGEICLALAILTVVPLAVSFFFGGAAAGVRFLGIGALAGVSGLFLSRIRAPSDVQLNEALITVTLGFLAAPLLMAYPMMAFGLDFVDAFFETTSGITTTGLSLGGPADRPQAFLLTRSWMQWYGGLGFVVFSAVLMRPGTAAMRLLTVEHRETDLVGGTRAHARRVLAVYAGLTIAGFPILWAVGADPLDAAVHTLSAVSTGGFSTHPASLGSLPVPVQAGVAVLFVAAALPFGIYWRSGRSGPRAFLDDPQLRALLFCGVALTLLLLVVLPGRTDMSWTDRAGHATLTAFSAQTTTGFSTLSPAEMPAAAKLLLILAMLVGGSAGSTAGGIKLLRLLLVARIVQLTLAATALPSHAVVHARLGDTRLRDDELRDALLVVLLFGAVVGVSWLAFLALGQTPLDALFEVVSATATVGLSTGLTRTELPPALKLVLCADMLLGRLELIAVFVLLYPRSWIGKRRLDS